MRIIRHASWLTVFVMLLLSGAVSRTAAAQGSDQRWQAWLGCWTLADSTRSQTEDTDLVCMVPAADLSGIEVLTVDAGQIVSRDTVRETSAPRRTVRGSCSGWESAEWSATGPWLYLQSEHTCPGGVTRTSSGLMAITYNGEWLDVRGLAAGGNKGVRVLRYRPADVAASRLPAEVATALENRDVEASAARMAAGRGIGVADVVEASGRLESSVVEAWLVENGRGYALEARDLVRLANSGVPGSVTDVMIALSYPRSFAINKQSRQGELRPAEWRGDSLGRNYPPHAGGGSIWDPFGYGYPGYGYGGYGYGMGYGYGYPRGGYGWYPGDRFIVVVSGPPAAEENSGGRVVKGRGYRRGRSESSGSSDSQPSSTDRGSSASSPSSEPSSSAGSSGSSGSGSGRTAKPRDP